MTRPIVILYLFFYPVLFMSYIHSFIMVALLQGALDHLDAVVLLQSLDERATDVHGHGSEDTLRKY